MLLRILLAFVSASIFMFISLYIISKILNKELYKDKQNFIIAYLSTIVISVFLYLFTTNFIRVLLLYLVLILASLYLFNEHKYKTILAAFFNYLIVTVSEMVVALIITFFIKDSNELINTFGLNFLVNIAIAILSVTIIRSNKICFRIQKYCDSVRNIKNSHIIFASITGLFFVCSFLYFTYFKLEITYLLLINILYIVLYSLLIYSYFRDLTITNNIKNEHDDLMMNLNEYERMYETMRINSHENKNQLLVIKGMVNKNNKKLLKYLDDITNTSHYENNECFSKLRKIPLGGLKGLIYYKILSMQEKSINVNIQIASSIKKEDFLNFSEETSAFVCKILGVLLDNAIEAVQLLSEKNIGIQIYKENEYVIISIANNYEGKIEFNKLGQKGFSTKSNKRGHGLSLVRKLTKESSYIENEQQVIGNIFKQHIKIRKQ